MDNSIKNVYLYTAPSMLTWTSSRPTWCPSPASTSPWWATPRWSPRPRRATSATPSARSPPPPSSPATRWSCATPGKVRTLSLHYFYNLRLWTHGPPTLVTLFYEYSQGSICPAACCTEETLLTRMWTRPSRRWRPWGASSSWSGAPRGSR